MSLHSNDFHDFLLGQYLINKSMLDVDSAGKGAGEIADWLLVWRRSLKRVFFEQPEQPLRFHFQGAAEWYPELGAELPLSYPQRPRIQAGRVHALQKTSILAQ